MTIIASVLVALTLIFFTIVSTTPQAQRGKAFHIIIGFVEVLIINCLLIILLIILSVSVWSSLSGLAYISLYGLGGLGVSQLLYVIPRSLFLRRRQRWAKLKGVIGAAVIVALLNGGCWVSLRGFGGV